MSTGNFLCMVSYPPWLHGVSYRQETVREGFPIRLGSMVFFTDRKLFAKGFLSGLAPWCFLPTGNYSPIVSCPAWPHGVSYPQETVREGFPIRLGSIVFLPHRKLFAKEISRLRFAPLEMTKGRGSMVLLTYRKLFTPPLTPVNCPLAAAALFLYT